jgi:hypothetical protein
MLTRRHVTHSSVGSGAGHRCRASRVAECMPYVRTAVVLVATLIAFGAVARAQDEMTQSLTIRLIVCPAHAAERPTLLLSGQPWLEKRGAPAQYLKDAVATRGRDGTWTFVTHVPPGRYFLRAEVPRSNGVAGCQDMQPFAVILGSDRHLVSALVDEFRLDNGEFFNRSVAGVLPFAGMAVTMQRLDYPMQEQPVAVDGLTYDAESFGPHPYVLRFYLPGSDKYASFDVNFRGTPGGANVRYDLGLSDLRAGLRTAWLGPYWGSAPPQPTPTYQLFQGAGAAAQAIVTAFADLVKQKALTGPAAGLSGYVVDERTQTPIPDAAEVRYYIEFVPVAHLDEKSQREQLGSGECQRDGRPHASYVVRSDMTIEQRDLCVPNP